MFNKIIYYLADKYGFSRWFHVFNWSTKLDGNYDLTECKVMRSRNHAKKYYNIRLSELYPKYHGLFPRAN